MIALYWFYRGVCWLAGWTEYLAGEVHFWAYENAFDIAKAREMDEWPN